MDASFTKVGPLENRTFPGEKRTIPPFRRRAGKPGDNRTVPSTKCLEYSVYVMAKAMAAAKGEKIRAMKNISLNTAYHLAK